jgi:hypothetical protein
LGIGGVEQGEPPEAESPEPPVCKGSADPRGGKGQRTKWKEHHFNGWRTQPVNAPFPQRRLLHRVCRMRCPTVRGADDSFSGCRRDIHQIRTRIRASRARSQRQFLNPARRCSANADEKRSILLMIDQTTLEEHHRRYAAKKGTHTNLCGAQKTRHTTFPTAHCCSTYMEPTNSNEDQCLPCEKPAAVPQPCPPMQC